MKTAIGLIVLMSTFFTGPTFQVHAQTNNANLSEAKAGLVINGFRVEALYLDDNDKPMGGRFVHVRTGFVLDLLQIQSVPQAYIYVNTHTVSDMGEPHTQEHLLIGKGNKGRNINVAESMSLTESNASTYQTYTDYTFNTAGGTDVFFERFENYMDALLHPDYTSEEVAREVRNWGVAENDDKTLRIEEKGSVYNEMTSSMNNPDWRIYDRMLRMLYGETHPLSFNAGGSPDGIRKMTDADIKRYHEANYYLGNMGAVVSVPKDISPGVVFQRFDAIFGRAEPGSTKRTFKTYKDLPKPSGAGVGKIEVIDYASENEAQPSSILLAMPATLSPDLTERLMLQTFMSVFAGEPSTNLYKKFIDGNTREIDTGAKGLYSYVEDSPGTPVFINFTDVPAKNLNSGMAKTIQQKVTEEFARIAAFKAGSAELKEFNERFRNALIDNRRNLSKFISTPPGFGFRSGGYGNTWLWHTRYLNDEREFKKSVTLKPQIARIERILASPENPWSEYLTKWGYTSITPYVAVARPEPKLIAQEEKERQARARAELDRMKARFKVTDDQEAIRRYRAAYEATTAELEKLERGATSKFISNPPLTLDDQIEYTETSIGKVKVGTSVFDNMTGATAGIALRVGAVPDSELVYLSVLPQMMRNTGVVRDGRALTYDEMSELLRKEILSLQVTTSASAITDRYEIIVRGAGNDPTESARAVEWMALLLKSPNWTKGNLPRMREVADQQWSALQRRMQDPEETWVSNPSDAFLYQDRPLYLATSSFLTQSHNFFRLRWMLRERGDTAVANAIDRFLKDLGSAKGTREELQALLAIMAGETTSVSNGLKSIADAFKSLPEAAKVIAADAAKDLRLLVPDLPDNSLSVDWQYLCDQMRRDLAQGPERTIEKLNSVRSRLLNTNSARMFYIGPSATRQKLSPGFANLLKGFVDTAPAPPQHSNSRLIDSRILSRSGGTDKPVYVGLLAPNMPGGVIINSAPVAGYGDTDREKIIDYLAARLYGGGGPHAVFTRTINAGLAYINGISISNDRGRINYYAERTPLLPQTLGFVVGEVKKPLNTPLIDYVTAPSFGSRASAPYETRGEAMAANMADGLTPDVVRKFRRAILEVRKIPDLSAQLWERKNRIYEKVLPGYGAKGRDIAGGHYFSIGPEKQLSAYEAYLKSADGKETRLYRIYPRDFWLQMK